MENKFCIILAGGIGSRFFPLSGKKYPKQFLDLFNENESLIQKTFKRISRFIEKENIYIVTYKKYFDLVKKHLPTLPEKNILCEPVQKNTAGSIAFGSYIIHKKNINSKILVCPADHLIEDNIKFQKIYHLGFEHLKKNNNIITLGISPTKPHTGYGYIKINHTNNQINNVLEFKEKPSLKTAKTFIDKGNYLWNSGIFMFNSKDIINEYKMLQPSIHKSFNMINDNLNYDIKKIFSNIDNISFDYAILEKSKTIQCMKVNINWSDLGSYSALYEKSKKDSNGNVCNSKESELYDCKDNIITLPKGKKIIIKGIDNYIIAEKDNTILIYPKKEDQDIKNLAK